LLTPIKSVGDWLMFLANFERAGNLHPQALQVYWATVLSKALEEGMRSTVDNWLSRNVNLTWIEFVNRSADGIAPRVLAPLQDRQTWFREPLTMLQQLRYKDQADFFGSCGALPHGGGSFSLVRTSVTGRASDQNVCQLVRCRTDEDVASLSWEVMGRVLRMGD
jgi:hypothetical protein